MKYDKLGYALILIIVILYFSWLNSNKKEAFHLRESFNKNVRNLKHKAKGVTESFGNSLRTVRKQIGL